MLLQSRYLHVWVTEVEFLYGRVERVVEEEKKGISLGGGEKYIVYLRLSTASAAEAQKMLGYEVESVIAAWHTGVRIERVVA